MFLKRVTVTGFKSFADKTVLELEPGITAVVGPNGSGKSNLADAIRWATGEQNRGRLRLADREEIIFAGSTRRAKASLAEVSLVFDNSDGAIPLELTEVEITRRLYRSGETDYQLAGRTVRLSDVQNLLARAGFGAGTYAVIGQGMIDSFILSSPADRKLLFEEAAGIRGPELSRESALKTLAATTTNLVRLRDIAAELEPRLYSLATSVAAAGEHTSLEGKVTQLRTAVTTAALAEHQTTLDEAAANQQKLTAELHRLRHECTTLARELRTRQTATDRATAARDQLQASLVTLEHTRDRLGLQLGESRAALVEAERAESRSTDLADRLTTARAAAKSTSARLAELTAELAANTAATTQAARAVAHAAELVAQAQKELVALRHNSASSPEAQYVNSALQILRLAASTLRADEPPVEQIHLLIHKAGRLLNLATRATTDEILNELAIAQKHLEAAMGKREIAIEHQTNIIITARSLEIDIAHQQAAVAQAEELVRLTQADLAPAQAAAAGAAKLKTHTDQLATDLANVTGQLEQQREQIRRLSAEATAAPTQLATDLERAQTATTTIEADLADLEGVRSTANAALRAAAARAKAWGLEPPLNPAPQNRSLAELEADLLKAEAKLEAQTAAYHDQTIEYQAVDTRHSGLMAQITDLEHAKADLDQLVTKLDGVVRERFKTNFAALAEQFSAYFQRLFGGGSASLQLYELDDGTYGIDIKASPKGKRLAGLQILSGGERALAGVALLAAILHVNPTPFVVLDEIDAALDEANSARLSHILGELAGHSQLIVITHNRQTMAAASVLFGVTTGEHHVSRLLSLRLEEASALAAR